MSGGLMQLVACGNYNYDFDNFNEHKIFGERFFYKYIKNHKIMKNHLNKAGKRERERERKRERERESGYVFNENENENKIIHHQSILQNDQNEPVLLRRIKQTQNNHIQNNHIQNKLLPNKIKKTIHWRILANLGGFIKKKGINDLVLCKYFIKPNNQLHYNKFILIDKIKIVLYYIQNKNKLIKQVKNYFNKFICVSLFEKEKLFQQHFFTNIVTQLKIKKYISTNFNFNQSSYTFNVLNKNIMKNTECPISTNEITEKYIECKHCLYCYDYDTCVIWLEQHSSCPMCNNYLENICRYNNYSIDFNNFNLFNTIETLNYVKKKLIN